MGVGATLRRVLANLREGRPAEAVRTGEPLPASAAYRQRMQAQAATDAWLQTLLPALPTTLHSTLQQCTAVHDDAPPITSLADLLRALTERRESLRFMLSRGGLPATAADQALLDDLADLLARLPRLPEPGGAARIPLTTR